MSEKLNSYQEKKYINQRKNKTTVRTAAQVPKFQKKAKLGNVRSIIRELRGREDQTYTLVDDMYVSPLDSSRSVKLHYSRGTMLADKQNVNVLEFNVGGSGFRHLRSDHKGVKGSHPFIGRFAKFKRWVKNIFTPNRGTKLTAKEQFVKENFGEGYQTVDKKGTQLKHARRRVKEKTVDINGIATTVNKTKISLAGPMAKSLNRGDYSIDKLRKYIEYMGSEYLSGIFDKAIKEGKDPGDVHILLKGHSRGAVAAVEGAMMLKEWVHNHPKYSDFENKIKFDLIQLEPVAGLGSNHGINAAVNHLSENGMSQSGDKMRALGSSANTTVMYSLHANHSDKLFTPQLIEGAKRVIITPFEHASGLKGFDDTQTDGNHRFSYTDAATGQRYRSSGLSELPEGVYMVDEEFNLIRMKDSKELETVMQRMTARVKTPQTDRYRIVKQAADSCFEALKKDLKKEENQLEGNEEVEEHSL